VGTETGDNELKKFLTILGFFDIIFIENVKEIKKMKIYVVCEDYTCAFYGMTTNQQEAVEMAQEIGGFVHEWEMVDGKLTCVDEL
jgi:hypothetical protein